MTNVATEQQSTDVAKPLRSYIPLIQEQIDLGDKAGVEFYAAAGSLLIDVREEHFRKDPAGFFAWSTKKFKRSHNTIRTWTVLAGEKKGKTFESLRDLHRQQGRPSEVNRPRGPARNWTGPVDQIARHARAEQLRLQQEDMMTRMQERQAEAKLARRLIDIGYKVLALELHPDKGGSREAMTRLNRVRDRLREHA
jgi:hypothetical protein